MVVVYAMIKINTTNTHTHTHTHITLMAYSFLQCPFVTLGIMGDEVTLK
jgi:hypothetical protein